MIFGAIRLPINTYNNGKIPEYLSKYLHSNAKDVQCKCMQIELDNQLNEPHRNEDSNEQSS